MEKNSTSKQEITGKVKCLFNIHNWVADFTTNYTKRSVCTHCGVHKWENDWQNANILRQPKENKPD